MSLNPYVLLGAVVGTVLLIAASAAAGRSWGSAVTANGFLTEKLQLVEDKRKLEADLKTKGDEYEKTRNDLQSQLNTSQANLARLRKSKPLECAIGPERLRQLVESIGAANRAVQPDGTVPAAPRPGQ